MVVIEKKKIEKELKIIVTINKKWRDTAYKCEEVIFPTINNISISRQYVFVDDIVFSFYNGKDANKFYSYFMTEINPNYNG